MSDSGLCCNLSLSITAERELFLALSGDLFAWPEGHGPEPSNDVVPELALALQLSESRTQFDRNTLNDLELKLVKFINTRQNRRR